MVVPSADADEAPPPPVEAEEPATESSLLPPARRRSFWWHFRAGFGGWRVAALVYSLDVVNCFALELSIWCCS